MPAQNINNYYFNKLDGQLNYSSYFDITLASDEKDYDDEVIFSNDIIAESDGNRLPINIDLNSSLSCKKQKLLWDIHYTGNTLVSKNYYNPNNEDLFCKTATTVCDIGLTGIDNGLYNKMTGETLTFTMGLNEFETFNPHYFDRRFKMSPVTSYAKYPNERFSANTNTVYNIVSKQNSNVGYYNELYGGFYQGFYKLFGYDYEVFPERVNKGWSAEMLLKPRQRDEYTIPSSKVYLNDLYPENSNTFFYFGARAENKFYHPATGEVVDPPVNPCDNCNFGFDITGGTEITYSSTTEGLECIKTCACYNTGVTNSNCIQVYPNTATTQIHNTSNCNSYTESIPNPPVDPAMDIVSNAMSVRFSGDPKNPKICVKYIKMTGDCITTVTCETTGVKYCSGFTINEICSSRGIYDVCGYNNPVCLTANTEERWVMITTTFERYKYLEDCDLLNWGGLNDIRQYLYPSSINGASYNLIMPPQTHEGSTKEKKENITKINEKWLRNKDRRLGVLKIYVNGLLFMAIEDFEEIIPRELNTQKEKQLGVPFNISFGGGTQGLRESLTFKSCDLLDGPYVQDPQCMVNETLLNSDFPELNTNILLESHFGGTFMGGISQFRMYTESLGSPQVQHNFRKLKNKFDLYDYWCSNCYQCLLGCYFDFSLEEVACDFDFIAEQVACDYNFELIQL
jgi:hypothetical protein